MKKKLYRSTHDRKICGVCGGIAEYFNMDPTIIRVIYALVSFFTSVIPGIIIYFILAFIIPEDTGFVDTDASHIDDNNQND